MAIVLRGATGFATATNTQDLAVTYPASLKVGDFMFAWCASNGSASYTWSDTADSFSTIAVAYTSGDACAQLLYKIATSADVTKAAASETFTLIMSQGEAWIALTGAYGNVASSPFDPATPSVSGTPGSGSTITGTGITTTKNNDRLLWFGGSATSAALPTITKPSSFNTQITQVNTSTGSGVQACALFADLAQATAGPTGSQNGSLSTGHGNCGFLTAISPGVSGVLLASFP